MKITSQKGFIGIDERIGIQNSASAASEMLNFRVTASGSLEKRPDLLISNQFGSDINGIWCGNIGNTEMVAVASGGILYRLPPNALQTTPAVIGQIGEGKCLLFEFNGLLYAKTENTYHKYDGSVFSKVAGYIPTVAINCGANGDGEIFEQINLLTSRRRQLISADGHSARYKLVEDDVDSVVSVSVNGVLTEAYNYGKEDSSVTFDDPPEEGLNNVEIIYSKTMPLSDKNRIMKCTQLMLFGGNSDGRAFLWGNPDYPNYRFHSDLANGVPSVEYFPINAFTVIGNSKINCIVQQYDKQLIFTKEEAYYSYSELRDDGLGNTFSSFPVYSLNGSKGCLFETSGCIIDNRPVTLCADGLNMWESTAIENEKNAVCFSGAINRSISNIINNKNSNPKIIDFQANHELFFICDGIAYIYNYGYGRWYVYSNFHCDYYTVYGSSLYLSYGKRLYLLNYENLPGFGTNCIWKSAYITNGEEVGNCDIVGFDADLYVRGPVTVTFGFEKNGVAQATREFHFREGDEGFCRVSFRPSIKRTMPFRLTFTQSGYGYAMLHGVSIKTREKERSSRYGIL